MIPPTGRFSSALFSVLLVDFVDTLGFSIVMPFLVFLVTRFGGNAFVFGLVSASYSAFQFVAAPILGRWSDRHGRKRILLLCEIGSLAGWVLLAIALTSPMKPIAQVQSVTLGDFTLTVPLILIFLARAVDGATGGNASVANAYVADISPEADRSRNFGYMGIASNLGVVAGPAVAGILGATRWGESLPVFAALAVSLLATLMVAFWLPESIPCVLTAAPGAGSMRKVFGQEHRDCIAPPRQTHDVTRVLALDHVPRILAVYVLTFLGFNFYYAAFPVHAARALGWGISGTGVYFAVLSLLMVLVQGPILAWAAKRLSPSQLIVGGSAILSVGFFLLPFRHPSAAAASVIFLAIGNGLMWPSVVASLSSFAGEQLQGTAQGLASSSGGAASIVGLLIGGFLYQRLGGSTFVLAGACILAAGLAAVPLLKAKLASA